MNDHQVLIINPFNSSLKTQLINTINTLQNVNYFLMDDPDAEIDTLQRCPSLVAVLLDNCNGKNLDLSKMETLHQIYPTTPILCFINTKNSGCKNCLNCQKFGWCFIHTPIYTEDVLFIIKWYLKENNKKKNQAIEFSLKQRSLFDLYKGNSLSTSNIKNKIVSVASLDVSVLLQGETGTGKELCAKLLHYLSKRSEGPFVSVNCGAIPTELFENELFGHKKGAYTHADTTEKGLINSAQHGTLFLDEIESLPKSSQVKLLRFLEDKQYKPLGQSSSVASDVRIIVASNCDLRQMVKNDSFRDDLFYRLSVVNIELPPLKERKDDIPILVQYFIEKFSKLYTKKILGIRPQAMMYLISHPWPGNIRELENMIQEAVIFNSNFWIDFDDLNFTKFGKNENFMLESFQKTKEQNIEDFEENYLKTVLKVFNGNVSRASGFAKKDRREFYRLIKKHKIKPSIYRLVK